MSKRDLHIHAHYAKINPQPARESSLLRRLRRSGKKKLSESVQGVDTITRAGYNIRVRVSQGTRTQNVDT